MKKKLWIIIVAILLLVLVGGYLGYKIYYVNYYDLSHIQNFEKIRENFVINEKKLTVTTTTLAEGEYFTYKNMKMKNIFDGYQSMYNSDEFEFPHSADSIWYVLKDNNLNKQIAAVGLARDESTYQQYKSGAVVFGDSRVGEIKELSKFFEKNEITNDIELLKFFDKTKNDKNSIFDSVENMKTFYSLHLLNAITYENIEDIILIDGNYEGYIMKYNMGGVTMIECNILKDEKRYGITFNNSTYFTDEMIKDLLNTLVIE